MRKSKLKDYIYVNMEGERRLYGRVYGDVRFPNGHLVLTTNVVEVKKDEEKNKDIAITENQTEYLLENEITKEEFIEKVKAKYEDEKYIEFILKPLGV